MSALQREVAIVFIGVWIEEEPELMVIVKRCGAVWCGGEVFCGLLCLQCSCMGGCGCFVLAVWADRVMAVAILDRELLMAVSYY